MLDEKRRFSLADTGHFDRQAASVNDETLLNQLKKLLGSQMRPWHMLLHALCCNPQIRQA